MWQQPLGDLQLQQMIDCWSNGHQLDFVGPAVASMRPEIEKFLLRSQLSNWKLRRQMRKITVDNIEFEWVAGRSFLRIRGNGHVVDLQMEKFLQEECGLPAQQAFDAAQSGERHFGVEPSDVMKYILKYGWTTSKAKRKTS